MNKARAWVLTAAASAFVATLVGCGGAGGDTQTTNPPAETINTKEQATARVDVNLATGNVKVTPMDPRQSDSLFTGSAVGITSSHVFTEPGELTVKRLKLSIKNNTPETIGANSGAMLVIDRLSTDDLGAVNLREFSNVSTVIGPGSSANDGPGPSVTITQPSGADVDSDGTLYVAGQGDGTLRKMKDNLVTRIATGLATPGGVATLPNTDFAFLTEQSTHNIVRVPKSGGAKYVIAGGGTAGLTDGSGAAARFNLPRDIVISGTTAFVADYNNDRIRKLTNLTGSAATVATLPVAPAITKPSGLAMMNLNGVDWLVVSSTQTHKVFIVNSATGASYQIAGTGVAGNADGLGTTASFNQPSDVAAQGSAIFVTEIGNRTIRQIMLKPGAEPKFAASWVVKTLAGAGTSGAIDGQGTVAQFASPRYLALDKSGTLYATDLTNNRVRRITGVSSALPITGTGGTGGMVEVANPDRFIPAPEIQTGRKAVFDIPALTPTGSVSDTAEKEVEFTLTGNATSFYFFISVIGEADSIGALDAVFNSTPNLKGSSNVNVRTLTGRAAGGVVDGDRATATYPSGTIYRAGGGIYSTSQFYGVVRRYDIATGVTRTIAGVQTNGGISTIVGIGSFTALPGVTGIWVNEAETEIYLVSNNDLVMRMSRSGGNPNSSNSWIVSIIAGADATPGNVVGDGTIARFFNPIGVAADPTGSTVYVSDSDNNSIKILKFIGDGSRDNAASWQVDLYTGDSGGAAGDGDGLYNVARFRTPAGLALSKDGNLYLAELAGCRVRRISGDRNCTTVAGSPIGETGAVDGVGPLARFYLPFNITLDESGFAYVSDLNNNVVRRVNLNTHEVRTTAGQTAITAASDGSGASAGFALIRGVTFAPGQGLYATDGYTLRLIERVIRTGSP
jgi:sugar lactone lactonase YvrE